MHGLGDDGQAQGQRLLALVVVDDEVRCRDRVEAEAGIVAGGGAAAGASGDGRARGRGNDVACGPRYRAWHPAPAPELHADTRPGRRPDSIRHIVPASFFSSASSVSASSGVSRSMSSALQPFGHVIAGGTRSGTVPAAAAARAGVRVTDGRPPRASSSCSSAVRISRARATTRRGRPGEPRHLDAVAAIGAARHDLPQEDDVVVPLARRHVEVHDARQRIGEVGELVVVRREQRLRPRARVAWRGTRPPPTRCSGRRTSPCRAQSRRARRGCREVARCRMLAVSCISTMKVDCPRAMLSDAPTRAKMRSTIGSFAVRAGTNDPACASRQMSAVCRR